jgi:hypothetical protein
MRSPADVLTRMLHAVDARDWDTTRASFADVVRVDYSSLNGQPAADVAADDLIGGWRAVMPGFDATQHLTGPCVVTGEELRTHVQAVHALDGAVWRLYGHYELRVVDARIAAMTLRVLFQEGDTALAQRAAARLAE